MDRKLHLVKTAKSRLEKQSRVAYAEAPRAGGPFMRLTKSIANHDGQHRRVLYLSEKELAGLMERHHTTGRDLSDLVREAIRKYLGIED